MRILTLFFFSVICLSAFAQKLPNVQQVGLRAPTNVKIDGKADEWGDLFQAYNKATGVFYNIANNDENLYLIIYSNNTDITTKILSNGINLCFNTSQKSATTGLRIKFPYQPSSRQELAERQSTVLSNVLDEDRKKTSQETQAGRLALNQAIVKQNKHIKIFGTKSLTDTLFSVYDAAGITAKLACPALGVLYYELCLPMKYLEFSPANQDKFYYNIRLNESHVSRYLIPGSSVESRTLPGGNDFATLLYSTDFWGEYTLAK